uniref:Protein EMBRYONIC FLOWER 1 n=1 Tax=Noccaea caerulescens TaxID=107243 RepID=A0A1J3I0A1_NOCCA
MESSIKINSISIDLGDAADGIDSGKCEHFSIRGFVAEVRERDYRKCWPFSEESVELRDHQSYCLSTLSVPKSRWWRCPSCIKDINDTDCRLQSQSRSVKERKLDAGSSAIPSKSLIVPDKKEKIRTVKLLKKVRRRAKDASKVKSKSSKLVASPEQASKRSKEKAVNGGETMEAVTAFGSFEVAGVVDDTPDKTIKKNDRYSHRDECDNASPVSRNLLGHNNRRKTRKVRLLSELLSNRNEQTPSKKESVRGRKRKSCGDDEESRPPDEMTNYASRILSTIGKTSENASKSCDSEENTVSGAESRPSVESHQSTDSGFDKVPIKGKLRNRRFQVVEDRFQETSTKDPYDYASPVRSSFPAKDLVPCPLHSQRTEKDLSVAKKRKRKAKIDDKKSTIINFSNSMDDGKNLVKQRKPDTFPQACSRDTMPQSTRDFLNSRWLDCSFDKLSARDSLPQLGDRPVFSLPLQERMPYKDDHRAMLKGIGANHFRNFGSSFKSTNAGDGCLRSGVNVNFSSNGGNAIRSSSSNDKLRYTEVADSSCALQKDIYLANGKGKEVAVQELPGASRIQSKTSEQIDDIPMEIVELMAKNQYERCLPDREEDKQPSQATTSVSKNALLIDLNETYDNTMDNTLRPPKPPLGNNATKEGHLLTGKPNSLDLFATSHFGQPYNVASGFARSSFTCDNQSSSIQFSGLVGQSSHSCHWLGNVTTAMATQQSPSPSSFRVLRACNTCQNVQQQQFREPSHPIWPSSITSPQHVHQPLSLSIPQKFIDKSTKLDNPNTRNLNFEGVDTYSNESSIPAMHLLSLMDPRLRSNIPTDTKFVKPPVNQSKELIGPQQGDCNKTAYAAKHWPFDLYSRRVTPETSREGFAVIPPATTSSFSLQSEKSSAENVDFTLQASWNHQHQEKKSKRKDNNFAPIYNNSNNHHQKPLFTSSSSDPGKFQLLGASDSMMLPLKFHMKDNAKKQKTKKAQSYNHVSACPPTSTSGPFVCSFNRNPADFTIPDAPGNVYMLKGDDFKVRKHAGSKKKPSLCKQDALKQNNKSLAPDAENA